MKLSEAILLGSTMGPQAFDVLKDGDATCALGAALQAVGIQVRDGAGILPHELFDILPCFSGELADCPVCASVNFLVHQIAHLNDNHRWTRERIAEWVATIEFEEALKEERHELDKGSSQGFSGTANQAGTGEIKEERIEAHAGVSS